MIGHMLKRDVLRNKTITFTLLTFITLSSLLMASAMSMVVDVWASVDRLFQQAKVPHFVQMHAGSIDQQRLDDFTKKQPLIQAQQTVEMLNIDQTTLFLKNRQQIDHNSVMDVSFVKQNQSFDFLLNLHNEKVEMASGEIGVPLYYMKKYDLHIGDQIWLATDEFEMAFTISTFIRDAQMNPSLVSSKRFVVNDMDWQMIKAHMGQSEYLLEFLLKDTAQLHEFEQMYQSMDLPQQGPTITYTLYKVLNAATEGLIAFVIMLISALLIFIALLCIRFIMMAALEEDAREIAVMKAIGIPRKQIQKLYLTKYIALAFTASTAGYVLALFISPLLTKNIALYMGVGKQSVWHYIIPCAGVFVIALLIIGYCQLILRKYQHISTVEALRTGHLTEKSSSKKGLLLHRSKKVNIHVFLGIKDIWARLNMYSVIGIVYMMCLFMMIVPVNFLYTIQSPSFITYMGAGHSQIRIDLQQTVDIEQRFLHMQETLRTDPDIVKYASFITSGYKVELQDGKYDSIHVETGDFSIFPLSYLKGKAPKQLGDIALSVLKAKELEKDIGDDIVLLINHQKHRLTISGIYQDMTNGGKTAKAYLDVPPTNILWYTVNVDMKQSIILDDKLEAYRDAFYPAKVTDVAHYLAQTFGTTIAQLQLVTKFAIVLALAIASLMTMMFMKMLLAKEATQIAIMRSLGFTVQILRLQYTIRIVCVVLLAIVSGMILAQTIGQVLLRQLGAIMGAPNIALLTHPYMSYLICPLLLLSIVLIAVWLSSKGLKQQKMLMKLGGE
ncbi:ABC transporter permease [Lysinibacillus piscis]|uniref:ABC transporter permease n=1 Tax=Lysinibacillus piscis TaxID=2518931 RepID=A0ABQ5NH48_9BACI|nr:ABC transporter permease [Lysinibacillus sp. KH24]GLC87685.1 ABC transporter permease [Lysinibacillus sp. KH24]